MKRLGIDIGSKTIKLALLDEEGALVYSTYLYHRSKVKRHLLSAIHHCTWIYGDDDVQVTVTGSAGMRVAELFDIPFVQEVVALKRAAEEYVPGTDVILEMGGEDTKLVYLTGVPEQRMNTVCAGGTGGFIDMMAGLMGVRSDKMQRLAMGYTTIYPIASRCAVFAKSDVRPLLNAGAKKEDVAASVLYAVCTQAVAGLSAGRPITGKVALLGGPFHHIPFMRQAFCKVTGIAASDAIIPENAHLFVAQGAALFDEKSAPLSFSAFERMIDEADFSTEEGIRRLPVLFSGKEEYEKFRARHDMCKIPRSDALSSNENFFIGIDAGSTTMKMALVNEAGELCAFQYDWNEGDVTESLPSMLKQLYREIGYAYMEKKIVRRSCIVGYGEDFCKAAYKIDTSEVETVAHLRAAREIDPEVDFLLDIGGQDIKCFYIRDGLIEDIVLNEACSSGCGSLFDSVARSMSMSKETLAGQALFAEHPVDLGTRCSTFMDSRVKHAQKEGATFGDIAAGVCWSTARNALFKVVRQPDFSKVGRHVVVQGGAFANDALLRAFELECGVEVRRPDLSQIMGAWGAALLARDEWLALKEADPERAAKVKSSILTEDELKELTIRKHVARCDMCSNQCKLMITRFFEGKDDVQGRSFVTGNRCERGGLAHDDTRAKAQVPPNMIKVRNALLASFDAKDQPDSSAIIGIPRALALFESYPFWKTFFNELGYMVASAPESSDELFRKGMSSIPAEGACYPSKLVYGHCVDAVEKGARYLFVPYMGQAFAREGLLGYPYDASQKECPLIEYAPDMIRENSAGTVLEDAVLIAPDLREAGVDDDIVTVLADALAAAGLVSARDDVARAFACARETYRDFFARLSAANANILAHIDAGDFPGALVAGHPYHADPGINHGIDDLLGNLGYAVVEQVDYDFAARAHTAEALAKSVGDWFANRELAASIEASEAHPNLQIIIPRSFGCGIDAVAADLLHDRIRTGAYPGKAAQPRGLQRVFAELKIDQIVDLAAVRIRLRSLAYAVRQRSGKTASGDLTDNWVLMSDEELARIAEERRRRVVSRERLERDRALSEARKKARALQQEKLEALRGGRSTVRAERDFEESASEFVIAVDVAHEAQARRMRALGFELVADFTAQEQGAPESVSDVVLFCSVKGIKEFATWDEVDAYLAEHEQTHGGNGKSGAVSLVAAAEQRQLKMLADHAAEIAGMKRIGAEFSSSLAVTDGLMFTTFRPRTLFFKTEHGLMSFLTWDEVRAYLEAHADGKADGGAKIPPVPAPAGVPATDDAVTPKRATIATVPGQTRIYNDLIGKSLNTQGQTPVHEGWSTINSAAAIPRDVTVKRHAYPVRQMEERGYALVGEYARPSEDAPFTGHPYSIFFSGEKGMRGFKTWKDVNRFLNGEELTGHEEEVVMPPLAKAPGLSSK